MPRHDPFEAQGGLRTGAYAVDREAHTRVTEGLVWPAKEGTPLVVVLRQRPVPANACHIEALGQTVAEANRDYPPQCDVVDVVYVDRLNERFGEDWQTWRRENVEAKFEAALAEHDRDTEMFRTMHVYTFPAPRLRDVGLLGEVTPNDAAEKARIYLRWLAEEKRKALEEGEE